ncbi:MAG: flagellar basal-body MS-ring/collar protein FliF [Rickettsiales bacterium]
MQQQAIGSYSMNAMVQSLREMNQVKIAALAGTAALLIGFFIFLSLNLSSPVMSPVYSNLSLEDSGQMTTELEKNNIPYEIGMGGTQILVATDKVEKARVLLARAGLPNSGSMVGYEIFDHSEALGTSNFVLNINKMRALEGEIGRTVSSMEGIEAARVHLVLPKRELFTRDQIQPTASVALKLRGSRQLAKEEIAAIQHLVATAVPGLKPSKITIIDNKGNLLARGVEDENDPEVMASTAQEFRTSYETKMKQTIERLLEQSVGMGKVKAEVNADIDFDRVVTNSEKFDPEGQVARSVQSTEENEQENEKDLKDNVSVQNNLPDANADKGAIVNQKNSNKTDETTNYEISKTTENHVKETGTVKRLSVAVLMDGVYKENKDGESVYTPRSAEELAQYATLVKSAIGFDEKRGDTVQVVNMPFVDSGKDMFAESPFDWLKNDLSSIIQTLVMGGVAALVVLLIIRPLVARTIASSEQAREEDMMNQAALGAPGGGIAGRLADLSGGDEEDDSLININRIEGGVKSSTLRKINELIERHPDETLSIIRQWAFEPAN